MLQMTAATFVINKGITNNMKVEALKYSGVLLECK